ncbi:hypothetical protein DCAR_0518747 [Daucus carota subsp. sativus]|uniref:MYND-type domain-containing protein n=1 Tax=Daucus carota subsp. sativus TaxID=79200 RepID=A0AAF0X110_DAUCS|nr:PREDICTED: F-box protein At5g50450-like [Daucus carota subsp. sativus]WOG99399.1 hypothetical protein DCAR_0518747 [Daucus carota subsp. sativus]
MMERRDERDAGDMVGRKRLRLSSDEGSDLFDSLPDDIVLLVLAKLSSSARSPRDFINVLSTCTRLNRLALQPAVLKEAGTNTVAVRAKNWSDSAHRFLKQCVRAGSTEATYFLGMIRFYCMEGRKFGAALIAKAAIRNHVPALYSLAIMQFNGSGGDKSSKDLLAGCALCARAGDLGHIDSIRELGYCYQDGYGVPRNLKGARSLLTRAAAMEVACCVRASSEDVIRKCETRLDAIMSFKTVPGANPGLGHAYWAGSGLQFSPRETHPANRFLLEWFAIQADSGSDPGRVGGVKLCSDLNCGRSETRENEFRRCSGCANVRYCSRGCQAHDWKVRHKFECSPMPQLVHHAVDEGF